MKFILNAAAFAAYLIGLPFVFVWELWEAGKPIGESEAELKRLEFELTAHEFEVRAIRQRADVLRRIIRRRKRSEAV